MKVFTTVIATTLLAMSLSAHAADITLKAKDGFALKADYYKSEKQSKRAVLMLHQCNYNRSMYNDIGQKLADKGIHALSLDFRGYGESVNAEFSFEKIQDLPREKRREEWRKMARNWPTDVQQAYDYLVKKVSDKGSVGVIGASCGGSQAITLAENNPIKTISFFSSGQREQNIERYKKQLADKATLIIAAQEDGNTFVSAQKLFETTTNTDSRLISYKGAEHGYPLLDSDQNLADTIAAWFEQQL